MRSFTWAWVAIVLGGLAAAACGMSISANDAPPDPAVPAAGDDGGLAPPSDARTPDSASASACAPRAAPADAPKAAPIALYPAPRFAAPGTLGAHAATACVDTSALASHATLDALVPGLLAEAGLKAAAPGACDCDWTLAFAAQPPALSRDAAAAWTSAGTNGERYLVASATAGDGRAKTSLFAARESSALWALRAALASLQGGRVPSAEIVDWPVVARRGIVEGIYGPSNANADCARANAYWEPYRVEDRNEAVRLLSRLRMNVYMYGPKCDRYSGPGGWRDAYPVGVAQVVGAAAHEATKNLVDFAWSVRPLDMFSSGAPYATELATLKTKLESVRALGVSRFALFWDDSYDYAGTVGQQIQLMNDVDAWIKSHDPTGHLIVVGQPYCGGPSPTSFCSGPNALTDAFGSGLHPDIEIFWTGPGVEPTTIAASDLVGINASYKRRVTLWDNWPCAGAAYCGGPGFHGRAGDLGGAIAGYYVNPVLNEYNGPALPVRKFFEVLGPIGDFTWNPSAYAASSAAEDASYARWQKLLASIEPAVGGCAPCGAYGAYWTCNTAHPNVLEFCDPDTHCLTDVRCAGGCEKRPDPEPDVCHF